MNKLNIVSFTVLLAVGFILYGCGTESGVPTPSLSPSASPSSPTPSKDSAAAMSASEMLNAATTAMQGAESFGYEVVYMQQKGNETPVPGQEEPPPVEGPVYANMPPELLQKLGAWLAKQPLVLNGEGAYLAPDRGRVRFLIGSSTSTVGDQTTEELDYFDTISLGGESYRNLSYLYLVSSDVASSVGNRLVSMNGPSNIVVNPFNRYGVPDLKAAQKPTIRGEESLNGESATRIEFTLPAERAEAKGVAWVDKKTSYIRKLQIIQITTSIDPRLTDTLTVTYSKFGEAIDLPIEKPVNVETPVPLSTWMTTP